MDPNKAKKKTKRMVGENGEVFYVTESEDEEYKAIQKAKQEKARRYNNIINISKGVETARREKDERVKGKRTATSQPEIIRTIAVENKRQREQRRIFGGGGLDKPCRNGVFIQHDEAGIPNERGGYVR